MKAFSKVLAVVLCLTMLCGLIPAAVLATDPEVIYQGASFGTNGYYNIISKNEWVLVPGAATETELVINNSTGTRRQVLHVIEVDPSNPDVSIVPGYNQIDKDVTKEEYWSHKELTEMAKYYEENLGYNIVGGMNTDLYYDTYAPRILVYNGKDLSVKGKTSPSQSILYVFQEADGTVSCDVKAFNRTEYDSYLESGRLLHAVSVSFGMVVKNGELVKKTEERTTAAAARSMVGIKEDGTLVICMNDGRGANNSIGLCDYEEGETMLALGCKWAANCDGGGSSTFLTKRVGEDEFTMRSVPCDGAQRPTSHGIFVASNVAPTGVLDVINIESDYKIFAPNTIYNFGAEAIDTHGYAMDMPADAVWALSDKSFGTIENGKFVSNGTKGKVDVQVISDGKVFGSKTITVADPETFTLSATSTVVPYSTPDKIRTIKLPIVSVTGEDNVYYDTNAVSVTLSDNKAGVLDGFAFTATEDTSVTGVVVTIKYFDITLTYTIEFGKGSEILWDFEDESLNGFLGQQDAFDWQAQQGIKEPMKSIIDAGNASFDVHSKAFLSSKENGGQVHNGKYALGIEFDMRYTNINSWAYANIYNVSNTDGSGVLRDVANGKKATVLGMWVYIPEGFYTEVNSGAMAIRGDFVAGKDAASAVRTNFNATYNGKTINSLKESDIPDNRWIYAVFTLSGYNYVSINNSLSTDNYSPCFARMYVKHHLAQKLTYYFDDFTLDYSSAVDDRNPPVISDATYCITDTNVAIAGSTIASNVVSFNAKIADFVAANAEGLDYSTGAIYIDGIKLSGVNALGTNLSVENVKLNAGKHTIVFEIADILGNSTTLTEEFTISDPNANTTVTLDGHNDSNAPAEAGSIYYLDLKTSDVENIKSVVATIELHTSNTWELEGMVAAPGFEVTYSVNPSENEFVTFTITKTDECVLTGEQTLLSIPVRIWNWDESWTCDNKGGTKTVAERIADSAQPVVSVSANVRYGAILYSDDSTGSFSDSFNCATVMTGAATNKFTLHVHDAELTILNKDATCTANGYANRTYCETCKSVVDWGTVIDATGHTYEMADGVVVCTNSDCDKTFTGTWTDGKDYVDGVAVADGWNGDYYYENGVKYTGIKAVDGVYYNFGEDGKSQGKYTGLIDNNGVNYYAIVGNLVSGWQMIGNKYYYFDTTTFAGLNGTYSSYQVASTSQNFTYNFENGLLENGAWVKMADGTRYYYGPSYYHNTTTEINGKTYSFRNNGYRYEGTCVIKYNPKGDYQLYEFTDDGVFLGELYVNGVYTVSDGSIYYFNNGIPQIPGLVLGDDGYYYYFHNSYTAVKNGSYTITNTNGLIKAGVYQFDENGRMIIKQGIYKDSDGEIRYYVDNVATYAGLVKDTDGSYYYISGSTLTAIKDCARYITFTNGLLPEGTYKFGPDGKMIIKNGIVKDEDGFIRYYVDGTATYAGLVKDTDGSYYYISGSTYAAVTDCSRYITFTNGLLPEGTYKFGPDGKMIIKNGIVKDADGMIRYYVNGTATYAGLVKDTDGNYYYISGNGCVAVTNCTKYITFTNGLLPEGNYKFDAEGKMILKQGVIKDADGEIRYYVNDVAVYAGLVQDAEGNYYYISGNGCVAVKNSTRYITFTNGLLPAGTYTFGADGKMIIG